MLIPPIKNENQVGLLNGSRINDGGPVSRQVEAENDHAYAVACKDFNTESAGDFAIDGLAVSVDTVISLCSRLDIRTGAIADDEIADDEIAVTHFKVESDNNSDHRTLAQVAAKKAFPADCAQ